MPTPRVCVILGTRPEAVKLASLIHSMRSRSPEEVRATIVSTGQHTELLEDALVDLGLRIDKVSTPIPARRDLTDLLEAVIGNVGAHLRKDPADLAVILGDTTSALGSALAAFNLRVPVIHIEAGLRSGKVSEPFPEEMNRRLLTRLASYHFATSEAARINLLQECVDPSRIFLIRNPVCDALAWALPGVIEPLPVKRPRILITVHRREDRRLKAAVLSKLVSCSTLSNDIEFILVLHPGLQEDPDVLSELRSLGNLSVIPHEPYFRFVARLAGASLVITDSGGISEEATQLGIPLVIFRSITERELLISLGAGSIVTLELDEIVLAIKDALNASPCTSELDPLPVESGVGDQVCTIILTKIAPNVS